jgi:hypothetical protein
MIDSPAIAARFNALSPFFDERERRLFAASEARAIGRALCVSLKEGDPIASSCPAITAEPRERDS